MRQFLMIKKLKVTKIEFETKDFKKIELSIEEAKDLYNQLHELFGSKTIPTIPIIIREHTPYGPQWIIKENTDNTGVIPCQLKYSADNTTDNVELGYN